MSCDCSQLLAHELSREALFDEGVEAARNACVAGAPLASAAITAGAWYDNPLTGAPAVRECMRRLHGLPFDCHAWQRAFTPGPHPETQDPAFSPGFGFIGSDPARAVLAAAERLRLHRPSLAVSPCVDFFLRHHARITTTSGPLNQAGLSALVFSDHGFTLDEAERSFLLFRIDPALREAELARRHGLATFPFFSDEYVYEGLRPEPRRHDLTALMREVGLD